VVTIVVEADLTHPASTQPAQQRCRTLVNFDAAALAATALPREDHDDVVALEELSGSLR
jgi:hypothetical protein